MLKPFLCNFFHSFLARVWKTVQMDVERNRGEQFEFMIRELKLVFRQNDVFISLAGYEIVAFVVVSSNTFHFVKFGMRRGNFFRA